MGRNRWGAKVLTQREREQITQQHIAERHAQQAQHHPTAAELVQKWDQERERELRRVMGSSDDGRAWSRKAAEKAPARSQPRDVPPPVWAAKTADRLGQRSNSEEE